MPPSARPDFGLPEQGAIGEHTTQASGYHPGIRVQFPSLPARGRRGRRAKTVLADCEDRILRPRWISCGEMEQPMSSFVRIMRCKQQVEDQCASHCYLLELITR